ncbi:hypothetical protein ACFQSB_33425 [Sphaerisporangium rhizosphaerae]|uniref:Uncharacterized protein n=1 Tax=Sphaerisporangium rhizosphaerae TaxID=2269375 RepID=A0ABW2PGI3_9ACTN
MLFEELELVEEQEADLDVTALWAAAEEVAPRAAARPLQLHRLHPGRRSPAPVA